MIGLLIAAILILTVIIVFSMLVGGFKMPKLNWKIYYIIALGIFVFFGFLIGLSNINSHEYYQEQYYNHLDSITQQVSETPKPEAIQHYEQKRDESVAVTEVNNIVEKIPENSTASNISVVGTMFAVTNPDGSINLLFIGFWAITIWIILRIME